MAIAKCGLNWKGESCEYHIDDNLKKNLDEIKEVVSSKNFDYISIVAGLPGKGKSTFAINLAKYCDPEFDISKIAFTAEEFISITTNCKKNSSVILDESFASLNSRTTMTPEFLDIVNHIQAIRQKNLYIFLCLPNFFDLSKGIAIYRSSHLFVVYGNNFGDRGKFAAFDRDAKRMLYIKGQKFMDYQCVKPNFRGRFVMQKVLNEQDYEDLKFVHLKNPEGMKSNEKTTRTKLQRDRLINYCRNNLNIPASELIKLTGLSKQQVYTIIEAKEVPT